MGSTNNNILFSDISERLDIVAKFRDTLTISVQACDAIGDPLDLTTYTLPKLQIRTIQTPGKLILELTNDITLDNQGVIDISYPNLLVPTGNYSYDFQITDPSGVVKTWFSGKFIVNSDITI